MQFAAKYQEVFASLGRSLAEADQIQDAVIAEHEERLGVRLPDALRTYYAVAGNMRQLNQAYNRLLAPASWKLDRRVLVFLTEHQGVVKWGVRATRSRQADPGVFYTVHEGGGEHSPWAREDLRCCDFMILMLCWQAVHGGLPFTGWAQVEPEVAEAVCARWDPGRRSRDLRAYLHPGKVLCVAGPSAPASSPGGRLDVLAAAKSEAEFGELAEELFQSGIDLEMP